MYYVIRILLFFTMCKSKAELKSKILLNCLVHLYVLFLIGFAYLRNSSKYFFLYILFSRLISFNNCLIFNTVGNACVFFLYNFRFMALGFFFIFKYILSFNLCFLFLSSVVHIVPEIFASTLSLKQCC